MPLENTNHITIEHVQKRHTLQKFQYAFIQSYKLHTFGETQLEVGIQCSVRYKYVVKFVLYFGVITLQILKSEK